MTKMTTKIKIKDLVIGQEAVCPDGLGRVIAISSKCPNEWIKVSTYVNDRQCCWDFHNVKIVNLIGLEGIDE